MTGPDLQLVADDLNVLKNVLRGRVLSATIEYASGTVQLEYGYGDDNDELQAESIY